VGEDVETLKRRMPLIEYLRQHNWKGSPVSHSEFLGLCPLHQETRPSFYVNTRKNVFYCHGCGQGGDLICFIQLSRHLSFRQSLACLDLQTTPSDDSAAVLEQTAAFYQQQLDHYPEALSYLNTRGLHDPVLIREHRLWRFFVSWDASAVIWSLRIWATLEASRLSQGKRERATMAQ